MTPLAQLKSDMHGAGRVHLNNAGIAPMSQVAKRVLIDLAEQMTLGTAGIGALIKRYEAARAAFAKLVGAPPDHISFFQTCAAAISQVAFGLPLSAGDNIVTLDQEYPSNRYPWIRATERVGAGVIVVPSRADYAVSVNDVIAAITPRTRAVVVSWVQFQTGTTLDLRPIADAVHKVGGWLCVDAIQGLGVLPFDLDNSGVDALCGGTHKWLLGPIGHGFAAFAPGRRDQLTPLMYGAMSYGTPDDAVDVTRPLRTDAKRFEPGNPLAMGAIAGAASVEQILAIGIDVINAEAHRIQRLATDAALSRGWRALSSTVGPPQRRSPILTLELPVASAPVVMALAQQSISIGARGGLNGIRISPHAHNTDDDIAALFAALDAEVARR